MRGGFAGLGRMGAHMARNLSDAGFELTLWNCSPQKSDALAAELGCAVASNPGALSNAADVVITMLADDPSSDAVHFGADGLFSGGAQTYVEMGTMSPDHILRLVQGAPEGACVIDAPVSGATQAAADAHWSSWQAARRKNPDRSVRCLMLWAKKPFALATRAAAR